MISKSLFFILFFLLSTQLWSNDYRLSLGPGYLRPSHPRAAFQVEVKTPLFLRCFRGQLGALTDGLDAGYVYGGAGLEFLFFKKLVFFPNFSPGIYFKGKGFDLGSPIEFRSCLELAFVINPKLWIGTQFFHLSNAHLNSHRNPGVNGWIFFLSFSK